MLLLPPASASAQPSPGYGQGPDYCSQYGNSNSGYSFWNVYACASTASDGATPFDSDGDTSFQCVELSARFLWAMYGIWAGPDTGVDDGADLVGVVHGNYPSIPVGGPTQWGVPVAGDVISLGPGGGSDPNFGHTAVVVWSDPDTGHFRIMSQNYPPGSAGEQLVGIDLRGRHNGQVFFGGTWTTASWLKLGSGRRRPNPPCVVPDLRNLTLGQATHALRRAHCRLGRVERTRPAPPGQYLHVSEQSARPHSKHRWGYRVGVILS